MTTRHRKDELDTTLENLERPVARRGERQMRSAIVMATAALCGCTSLTTIQSSWSDPTFSGEAFDRIAVVGLFDTTAESRTFEQTAARALEQRGIDVVPAYTLLDEDRMYEEPELRVELAEANVDGILIYRMIAVDERDVYRNPTPYIRAPDGVIFGDPYYWYYHPNGAITGIGARAGTSLARRAIGSRCNTSSSNRRFTTLGATGSCGLLARVRSTIRSLPHSRTWSSSE